MAGAGWLAFRVGPWHYAAPVARVREVLRPVRAVRLPRAAPFVRGLFNLRGQILPLVDLGSRLGTEAVPSPGRERVVVVEAVGGAFGIRVDEVLEVLDEAAGDPQRPDGPLSLPDPSLVAGVLDLNGRLVFTLDLERVFGSPAAAAGV